MRIRNERFILFIPEITAEMFRNGCLESIQALMAEGEIYDIDYQQPCEDCISRQAAKDKIKNICDEYRLSYEDGERKAATGGSAYALGHAFDDLPSVTPQQKLGRWIDDKCSVCGNGIEDLISSSEWYRNEEPNFCPFCGAKMEV